MIEIAQTRQEVEPDARDQNGGDRHQRDDVAGGEPHAQHRALVLAEQLLDALERDRIHVPGVARNVGHPLDPAVMRGVKAVIHARR